MTAGPVKTPTEAADRETRARSVPLGLVDIVAVSDIVAALTGRPLSPFESSGLRSASNSSHTLTVLADVLAA